MATPVHPVPDLFPGRSPDGAAAGQRDEACLRLQAVRVIALAQVSSCPDLFLEWAATGLINANGRPPRRSAERQSE